jgi:hypothetical protein
VSDPENSAGGTGFAARSGVDLEPAPQRYVAPPKDRRPHMPEPPPVRLVAVEDVYVYSGSGLERPLDAFYVELLRFEREAHARDTDEALIVYRAENARLIFEVIEPPLQHQDFRPIGIEVPSLAMIEQQIVEREIEYERLKGMVVGQETLVLRDPAGNWVALSEFRRIN